MANKIEASLQKILDTADSEVGADVTMVDREHNLNRLSKIQFFVASGDQIILEGKLDESLDYSTIYTASSDSIINMDLPSVYRATRTTDGEAGDSQVWVKRLGEY